MAETPVLSTQPRKGVGSREAQRLRKSGATPAIVYGHKETPDQVSVSHEELENAVRHHARMLELQISGKKQLVLIQDLQYDHLGKEILHADFLRVSATDTIHLTVPVELRGVAAGSKAGGVLIQPLHNLHVECLVSARPDSIRVKIDDLQIGQAIHIRELQIPQGVKILHDADAVVVQIKQPVVVVEPTVAAVPVEGAAAEPEVITAKKKETEEGEEE
jgi:large subunit ribosomal protein L25